MLLLGIPPILVAAYAGLRAVDRDLIEAGRGHGHDRPPDPAPASSFRSSIAVIVGGFRTATLQVIATATIGAVLLYGGLGRFIIDGLARSEPRRLFAGAILVAVLALGVDAILALVQRAADAQGAAPEGRGQPLDDRGHRSVARGSVAAGS